VLNKCGLHQLSVLENVINKFLGTSTYLNEYRSKLIFNVNSIATYQEKAVFDMNYGQGDFPLNDQFHDSFIKKGVSARSEGNWRSLEQIQQVIFLLFMIRKVQVLVIVNFIKINSDCVRCGSKFVLESRILLRY